MTERSIWSYVQLSTTSIEIQEDIPFDRWEELGDKLHELIETGRWGLGAWAAFGERKFGDDYTSVIAPSKSRRIEQALWVHRSVPLEIRHENLSWSHHKAIAGIRDHELQRKLLDMAEANEWDVSTLAKAVSEAKKASGNVQAASEPAEVATATRLFGAGGRAREREAVPAATPAPETEKPTTEPPQGFTPRVVGGTEHSGPDPMPVEPHSFLWAVVEAAREAIQKGEITDELREAVRAVDSLEAIAKRQAG